MLVAACAFASLSPCDSMLADAVAVGDLHKARLQAVHYSQRRRRSTAFHAITVGASSNADGNADGNGPLDDLVASECATAWRQLLDAFIQRSDALTRIHTQHRRQHEAEPLPAASNRSMQSCIPDDPSAYQSHWDACCSSLRLPPVVDGCPHDCCALGTHTQAHLLLPALREVSMTMHLMGGQLMTIEQDGFLRPFDVSTGTRGISC